MTKAPAALGRGFSLIVRAAVKIARHLIGFQDVDKGARVDLAHCAGDLLDLITRDDRIDHIALRAVVQPDAMKQRGAVVGGSV